MVTATTIKKGYKQTELGVIPEDWEIIEIKDATISHKQGYYTKDRYIESGIRLVRITDLHNPKIDYAAMPTLRISKRDFDLYKINVGDFLFARSGAIGRYGIVHEKVDAIFGSYIIRFVFDSSKLINEYFGFIYETDIIWKQLLSITQGSSNININATNIKSLKVAIPLKKEEQNTITTILSDTDALIERLEKLIAKKKAIKQGTMQQLLTGKKRLPGFSGEWDVKKLGEVATVIGGGTPSTYTPNYWNGMFNWFTPTEIGLNKYAYHSLRKITKEGLENCSARILPKGTVLLTTRAGIGDVSILMNEGCTNQGFQSLVANKDVSYEFLYYLVLTLKNVLNQNASGSTFLEISPNRIKQIEVKISNLKEQNAIATILSDMDAEIENLEQSRDKYTMLKQGMMQQLLTGRIRIHDTN